MIILYCVTIMFFTILYGITLYNCDICLQTQTNTITETKEILIEKEILNNSDKSFPCIVRVLSWDGEDYIENYQFVDNCYKVIK